MTEGLVSVVIPCFNSARYVGRAVRSVLAQTYQSIEIVVVDDGSTDGFEEAMAGLSDRLHVLRQENAGVAVARNRGIEGRQSEFVAFLDADDVWHPEKIARQVAFLRGHPEHILVYTALRAIDESSQPLAGHHGWAGRAVLEGACLDGLVAANPIQPSSVLVRRHAIGHERFEQGTSPAEDWDLWLRLAHRGPIGYLPQPLTDYRCHGENASKNHQRMARGVVAMLDRALARESARPGTARPEIVRAIGRQRDAARCRVGHLAYDCGEFEEAGRWFRLGWAALTATGWLRLSATMLPHGLHRYLQSWWRWFRRENPTSAAYRRREAVSATK